MRTNTSRASQLTARLGLESLEGRTLLSATLPTPAPTVGHVASTTTLQVHHQAATQARMVGFSYQWCVGPSAVIVGTNPTTGNGKSTGSVDFALVRGGGDTVRPAPAPCPSASS
jgi:hypothetical protein